MMDPKPGCRAPTVRTLGPRLSAPWGPETRKNLGWSQTGARVIRAEAHPQVLPLSRSQACMQLNKKYYIPAEQGVTQVKQNRDTGYRAFAQVGVSG